MNVGSKIQYKWFSVLYLFIYSMKLGPFWPIWLGCYCMRKEGRKLPQRTLAKWPNGYWSVRVPLTALVKGKQWPPAPPGMLSKCTVWRQCIKLLQLTVNRISAPVTIKILVCVEMSGPFRHKHPHSPPRTACDWNLSCARSRFSFTSRASTSARSHILLGAVVQKP